MGRSRSGHHISLKLVVTVFSGVCLWCGRRVDPDAPPFTALSPTREHMIHFSRGGKGARSNLALACYDCNNGRGDHLHPPGADLDACASRSPAHAAAIRVLRAGSPEERDRAEQDLAYLYHLVESRWVAEAAAQAREELRRNAEAMYLHLFKRSPRRRGSARG